MLFPCSIPEESSVYIAWIKNFSERSSIIEKQGKMTKSDNMETRKNSKQMARAIYFLLSLALYMLARHWQKDIIIV